MADQLYADSVYFGGFDGQGQIAEIYKAKAGFSIKNGMLYGSFHLTENGQWIKAGLGDAEYRVFDRSGNLVSGLSQVGLSADSEGLFIIAPVSAASINENEHYTIEITISYQGQDRVSSVFAGILS